MTLGLLAGVVWAEQEWVSGWQRGSKGLVRGHHLVHLPDSDLLSTDRRLAWKARGTAQHGWLYLSPVCLSRSKFLRRAAFFLRSPVHLLN